VFLECSIEPTYFGFHHPRVSPPTRFVAHKKAPRRSKIFATIAVITWHQAANIAYQQPTIKELQTLILQLQQQVILLTAASPVAAAFPATGTATVIFTVTPQTLGTNNLTDYLSKRGLAIFE
jgi:hypothetical protein